MGFLRTIGRTLFGGSVMGNLGNEGSMGRSATIPRTVPEPTEYDEIDDSERAIAEDRAARILDEWSEDEQRVLSGAWIETPQSSHTKAFRFKADDGALEFEFQDGSFYRVDPIKLEEAMELFYAPSKGGWYWDVVRVRGTPLGHKKNYVFLSGPSGATRKWHERGPAAGAAHAREVDRQSANPSAYVFGKGGLGKKRGRKKK